MNTPTTHPLDKYAPQALDLIAASVERYALTKRDRDNPRWLIVDNNGKVASSQGLIPAGAIAIDPLDLNLWQQHGPDGYTGEQWFRALKHAYLDALALPGGMPKDSRFRDLQNKVLPVSAQAAEVIAATVPPKPEPAPVPSAPAKVAPTVPKDGLVTPDTIRDMIDAGQYTEAADLAMQTAGIALSFKLSDTKEPGWEWEGRNSGYRPHWKVTIKSRTGRTTIDFWDSLNAGRNGAPQPSAYSFLSCLTWSDPDTFTEWCASLGYDKDSRKAEKTWKATRREFLALGRVVVNEGDRELLAAIM